jgi:predicted DCC family thiol-disulfide oxidoreductase YuxK
MDIQNSELLCRPNNGTPKRWIVYFDGGCPICRREINLYRRRIDVSLVQWLDLSQTNADMVASDLKRSDAMAQFHVRRPDGRLERGAVAFGVLWSIVPGFRWLGLLTHFRFSRMVMDVAYRCFLRLRPTLQGIAQINLTTRQPPNGSKCN